MDIRDNDCIKNYLEFKDEETEMVANRYIDDLMIFLGNMILIIII